MASPPLPFAWHNHQLQAITDVHISPLDRGFLFGDGVYEVIPFYDGHAVGLQGHLDRLKRSLAAIALCAPVDDATLADIFSQVVEANGSRTQSLYLQVSRTGDRGRDHRFPDTIDSSLFVMTTALEAPSAEQYLHGHKAILRHDERWARCDIKSISLLANVLAKQAAAESDAIESILHRDGFITEGAASAVACVIDGVLVAPPMDESLLPSVTRDLIWAVAQRIGQATEIRPISVSACLAADEVVLMSSTKEIVPIVRIDEHQIGTGKAGDVWQRLFDGYQAMKKTI